MNERLIAALAAIDDHPSEFESVLYAISCEDFIDVLVYQIEEVECLV